MARTKDFLSAQPKHLAFITTKRRALYDGYSPGDDKVWPSGKKCQVLERQPLSEFMVRV